MRYYYDPDGPCGHFGPLVGLIIIGGSISSIVYYIVSMISLFNGHYSANVLYSIGLILLVGIIVFLERIIPTFFL